jgi:putative membrane protein
MLIWARNLAVAFVALQHLGFLVLEMFLWKGPTGRRIFRTTPEFAAQSAPLAANQGLYNGFLAAGLCWSLLAGEPMAEALRLFFLVCVAVAAVFGAATVGRRILWVQGFPAAVALLLDRLVRS